MQALLTHSFAPDCFPTTMQIWERRRRIPSTTYNDPLDHIFTEFDEDGDGHLTSEEIATALKSRNVEITPDQIKEFIRGERASVCGAVVHNNE
jgi:Ca2+-binding EF-hand superfamily protein